MQLMQWKRSQQQQPPPAGYWRILAQHVSPTAALAAQHNMWDLCSLFLELLLFLLELLLSFWNLFGAIKRRLHRPNVLFLTLWEPVTETLCCKLFNFLKVSFSDVSQLPVGVMMHHSFCRDEILVVGGTTESILQSNSSSHESTTDGNLAALTSLPARKQNQPQLQVFKWNSYLSEKKLPTNSEKTK